MILVQYENKKGLLCQAYVFRQSDDPKKGIQYNPPDLSTLNLNTDTEIVLNKALIRDNLISYQDVLNSQNGASAVLKRLGLIHLRKQLITLYKLEK